MATATTQSTECGATLRRGVRAVTWTYRGLAVQCDQPGWWCDDTACDGNELDESDLLATQGLLLAHKTEAERGLTADDVRRIRTRLGVSQREASLVLGGGPNAFYKYEKGEVEVSQAFGTLLRLLDTHRELWAEIKGTRRFDGAWPKAGTARRGGVLRRLRPA